MGEMRLNRFFPDSLAISYCCWTCRLPLLDLPFFIYFNSKQWIKEMCLIAKDKFSYFLQCPSFLDVILQWSFDQFNNVMGKVPFSLARFFANRINEVPAENELVALLLAWESFWKFQTSSARKCFSTKAFKAVKHSPSNIEIR